MARIIGILALAVMVMTGFMKPASAEFFGCDDQHATRYSRGLSATRSYTQDFAAQSRARHYSSRRVTVSHAWSDRSRW
jgi:hypothetical protein